MYDFAYIQHLMEKPEQTFLSTQYIHIHIYKQDYIRDHTYKSNAHTDTFLSHKSPRAERRDSRALLPKSSLNSPSVTLVCGCNSCGLSCQPDL